MDEDSEDYGKPLQFLPNDVNPSNNQPIYGFQIGSNEYSFTAYQPQDLPLLSKQIFKPSQIYYDILTKYYTQCRYPIKFLTDCFPTMLLQGFPKIKVDDTESSSTLNKLKIDKQDLNDISILSHYAKYYYPQTNFIEDDEQANLINKDMIGGGLFQNLKIFQDSVLYDQQNKIEPKYTFLLKLSNISTSYYVQNFFGALNSILFCIQRFVAGYYIILDTVSNVYIFDNDMYDILEQIDDQITDKSEINIAKMLFNITLNHNKSTQNLILTFKQVQCLMNYINFCLSMLYMYKSHEYRLIYILISCYKFLFLIEDYEKKFKDGIYPLEEIEDFIQTTDQENDAEYISASNLKQYFEKHENDIYSVMNCFNHIKNFSLGSIQNQSYTNFNKPDYCYNYLADVDLYNQLGLNSSYQAYQKYKTKETLDFIDKYYFYHPNDYQQFTIKDLFTDDYDLTKNSTVSKMRSGYLINSYDFIVDPNQYTSAMDLTHEELLDTDCSTLSDFDVNNPVILENDTINNLNCLLYNQSLYFSPFIQKHILSPNIQNLNSTDIQIVNQNKVLYHIYKIQNRRSRLFKCNFRILNNLHIQIINYNNNTNLDDNYKNGERKNNLGQTTQQLLGLDHIAYTLNNYINYINQDRWNSDVYNDVQGYDKLYQEKISNERFSNYQECILCAQYTLFQLYMQSYILKPEYQREALQQLLNNN